MKRKRPLRKAAWHTEEPAEKHEPVTVTMTRWQTRTYELRADHGALTMLLLVKDPAVPSQLCSSTGLNMAPCPSQREGQKTEGEAG